MHSVTFRDVIYFGFKLFYFYFYFFFFFEKNEGIKSKTEIACHLITRGNDWTFFSTVSYVSVAKRDWVESREKKKNWLTCEHWEPDFQFFFLSLVFLFRNGQGKKVAAAMLDSLVGFTTPLPESLPAPTSNMIFTVLSPSHTTPEKEPPFFPERKAYPNFSYKSVTIKRMKKTCAESSHHLVAFKVIKKILRPPFTWKKNNEPTLNWHCILLANNLVWKKNGIMWCVLYFVNFLCSRVIFTTSNTAVPPRAVESFDRNSVFLNVTNWKKR